MFGFQNLELSLQVKNSNINLKPESKEVQKEGEDFDNEEADAVDEGSNKVKLNYWNHISVVYDNSQQKKLLFYINCNLIASSETTLPSDLFKDQNLFIANQKLTAELTEFRFWGSSLSLSEIKEQYRMPLEMVYEKKKEITVKFKAIADKKAGAVGLPKPLGVSLFTKNFLILKFGFNYIT